MWLPLLNSPLVFFDTELEMAPARLGDMYELENAPERWC